MAVRVKVVAQYMTVQAGVYIEEPSRFRIIIPTLQIVQFGLSIVVVPAVAEGVICPHDALLHRGRIGCRAEGEIPPGVIRIRTDFLSGGVIDSNNVPLQVLLEVVGVKRPCRITGPVVLQTHGQAVLIVQIDQQVVEGLRPAAVPGVLGLTDDLRAVQRVPVHRRAVGLFRPDALVIVLEGVLELPGVHGHLHKLAAAPGQGVAVVCSRITNAIV